MWNYATVTQTVVSVPPTVTILQQDPNSIANTMAPIDSLQVSQESEEQPVSGQRYPTSVTFIHTISVSGYEATELANPGASVFYLSQAPADTNSPWASIAALTTTVTVLPANVAATTGSTTGTTTVTVLPVPVVNSDQQEVQSNTTAGWNTASTDSSYGPPAPLSSSTEVQPTQPVPIATATVTQFATVYSTATAPANGYGTSANGHHAFTNNDKAGSPNGDDLEKRQTCVWISATIDGQEVGWCNNWAGGSTLTFTSWETTTTPTYIPGIGPITQSSTSTTDSAAGSVTIETSTDLASSSQASATPSACGQTGPFQIGFDDLPVYSTTDNNTADFPPIFNPYEHFFWGDGWAYVPPPNEPFPPQSGNRLAQFIPSLNNTVDGSTDAGTIPPSSFGAGPRNYDDNYWFSASSAYVGCDNGSRNLSSICDFVATAYQWDNVTQSEVVVATQHFRIPPCPDFIKCQLTEIDFNYLFYKMSTLSFYANVQGQLSQFWIDSIDLNWYNNTCAAGLAREQSRKV
ncbi:uncharacterized protein Z520_01038 [Fonsecaea multimorphosa CBS 102226]|uniref:DUF7371 domain-containing protein n=1 Tax=Fonsecaea multimorphosa CBS 102226 TaxID=1442371 RepID=A0A0D2K916_9EURO|nr:uncharacterized protein Z520_01038 [Fonsecaea multimorphosa CBS 102226]KIY02573.1 hypothetical protein Z520_01038 [Fonsecaea multimorphosa CBS 102226]